MVMTMMIFGVGIGTYVNINIQHLVLELDRTLRLLFQLSQQINYYVPAIVSNLVSIED